MKTEKCLNLFFFKFFFCSQLVSLQVNKFRFSVHFSTEISAETERCNDTETEMHTETETESFRSLQLIAQETTVREELGSTPSNG